MGAISLSIFVLILLISCYTDIKKREIPDTVCIMIAVLSLFHFQPLGLLVALPFYIAALLCPDKTGGGDIKLIAAVGLYLGLEKTLFGVVVALIIFIVFYYLTKTKTPSLPLAPFLTIGFLLSFLL